MWNICVVDMVIISLIDSNFGTSGKLRYVPCFIHESSESLMDLSSIEEMMSSAVACVLIWLDHGGAEVKCISGVRAC